MIDNILDCPFEFVTPLGENEDEWNICAKQINNIIMRNISDLRIIYQHYANHKKITYGPKSNEFNRVMTRSQLWQLFKDCQLTLSGTSLAEMNRALGESFKSDDFNYLLYTVIQYINLN